MKRLLPLILLAGCATQPDIPGAVHVQAFGPDGSARSSLHPETMRDAQQRGLVIAYDTGDVIDLQWQLDSNVITVDKQDPITVRLLQPVWLYSGPGGIWLSTDGTQFRPWSSAIGGHFQFSLGLDGTDLRNTADLGFQGNLNQ